MEFDSGDTYTGTITGVMPNDTVSYYLYAADESGRHTMQPYIGEPDPFVFTNIYFPVTEIGFNPDTVKFLTYDQMMYGIPLNIINKVSDKVTITSITEFGFAFPWNVEEMPVLPIDIEANDTLKLTILCPLTTSKGALIIDTMFVETLLDSYTEIIAIDSDLVGINIQLKDDIQVYPNPFTNQVNFSFNNPYGNDVIIQIFDITGKLIIDVVEPMDGTGTISIDLDGNNTMLPGSYYYKITSGDVSKSGKLIKVD